MTTATKITLSRIAFIPVVVTVYLLNFPGHRMLAGVLFAIAALSDLIDGYVARKYNQVSDLGKFLDPIADKMLVVVFMFLFVADNLIFNPWGAIVCGVVLSREFMISAFRMQAAVKKIVIPADVWGKLKTDFQDVGSAVIIFASDPIFLSHGDGAAMVGKVLMYIGLVAFFIGAALAVYSGVNYIVKNKNVFTQKEEA